MIELDFHTLTIADRAAVQAVTLTSGRCNCNFSFANLVGWQFWYSTEVCVLPGAVVLRFSLEGKCAYMLCMPGTPSCELLEALCADCGHRLTLLGLEDEAALQLRRNACRKGIDISVEPRRDQFDYIYRRERLASLRGGKLQAKRNHVNRFKSLYDYRYEPLRPRIFKDLGLFRIFFKVGRELRRVPFCHAQVVHQIMSAVYRRCAGDLLNVIDPAEGAPHQLKNLPGRTAALDNEVKAGQASHGAPVDDLVFPQWIVPEKGGYDVLQRVHGRHVDHRLPVRPFQSDVIGRNRIFAQMIDPAREYTGNDARVVYGKALDEFHIDFLLFVSQRDLVFNVQ